MSSFSKLFSGRPAAPPKERRTFARRLSSFEPRSFRGAYEPLVPPEPMPQYKPPSVIAGHKVIVLIFATVCLALTVYWIRAVRTAKAAPAPVQSVYIEMLPANDPPQPK